MAGFIGYVVPASGDIEGSMGCPACPPCPPCPPSHVYRMRAVDDTLARNVFWTSSSVDVIGGDYGGPGPLSNVVVQGVNKD